MYFKFHGKKFEVLTVKDWSFEKRPGGWWIATHTDGRRLRLMAWGRKGMPGVWSSAVQGLLWNGQWMEEQPGLLGGHKGQDSDLLAQFPGKVRKVLVEVGASVTEGDVLVLVEAMKMEFAIKAPHAGTILRLHVEEGQQISAGDRFLDLKPSEGA